MKYGLLVCSLLVTAYSYTMDGDKQLRLTDKEQECYNWFVERQKDLPSTILQLSPEDREVFKKQTKFKDDPKAVTLSRENFATAFYDAAIAADPLHALPYEKEFLKATFVKMAQIMGSGQKVTNPTTYVESCMWAWETLEEKERMTFSEDAYAKDPESTKKVTDTLTDRICSKLIELKLLTPEEKAAKKQELYDERLARFEKQYKGK